ncbi:MAG: mechanosensitive ion channel family protein [Treponema sp.]|jgi:small-conductance mechanosensitive channel|nr:mechanosensitive ion channel family protein [Treponema sp.]
MIELDATIKKMISESDPAELLLKLAGMVFTVLFIIVVFNLSQYFLGKFLKGKITPERNLMVKKVIRYTGFVLAVLFVFKSMGIDASALLGAAGIAGIVLGFAAQASVSSFIAGFFLLSEKPFSVGDTIRVEGISGVVLSVDLLSVKLRTYDNLFVRIPNETIIKSNLVTVTRFPIRRLDLAFDIAYREDPERVRKILLEIAASNPYCLENPAPFFGIDTFGASGIGVLFNTWFEKNNFWNLKNSILIEIRKSFEEAGIEIPYQKIDINISNAKEDTYG